MDQIESSSTRRSDPDDAMPRGINLITVLLMLAVLVALVVVIFWGFPQWFGSRTINVNIRT